MGKRTVLTGVTTTGTPHLGNYAGAIRPAIAASRRTDADTFYFLADYHSLVKNHDPDAVHRSSLEVAATWLALVSARMRLRKSEGTVRLPLKRAQA